MTISAATAGGVLRLNRKPPLAALSTKLGPKFGAKTCPKTGRQSFDHRDAAQP